MKWIKIFLFLGVLVVLGAISQARADWPDLTEAYPWEWEVRHFSINPQDSIPNCSDLTAPSTPTIIKVLDEKWAHSSQKSGVRSLFRLHKER